MGAVAAADGRRGPGMPGSAKMFPGEYVSRASGFAGGMPLDTAPGCVIPAGFAGKINLTVPAITLLDLADRLTTEATMNL